MEATSDWGNRWHSFLSPSLLGIVPTRHIKVGKTCSVFTSKHESFASGQIQRGAKESGIVRREVSEFFFCPVACSGTFWLSIVNCMCLQLQ